MTRPFAVLALAAALAAAGCGGGNSKHRAITDYINQVNTVEKQLAKPFAAVSTANESFASAKKQTPHVELQLAASERTMRTLSRRLAAIPAPPEAARLRTLLLELVNRERALAHEVDELFTFVPAFQAAIAPLASAGTNLKTELGQTAKTSAATKALDLEKADALDTYAETVERSIVELRRLRPPAVWQPGYTSQLASLNDLRSSALALAVAVRGNDAAALPRLLDRFDQAAVSDESTPAQKAERAAVVAYNGRIKSLSTLARKIDTERGHLQGVYG